MVRNRGVYTTTPLISPLIYGSLIRRFGPARRFAEARNAPVRRERRARNTEHVSKHPPRRSLHAAGRKLVLAVYPHAEQPERAVRAQKKRCDLQHLERVPKHDVRVPRRVGAERSRAAAPLRRLAGVVAALHPQNLFKVARQIEPKQRG